jgi:ATP-dependent RNA helicase DDX54/DBP10
MSEKTTYEPVANENIDFISFEGVNEGDKQKKKKLKKKGRDFLVMGLPRPLLRGIFRIGYETPTPIQRKVIPKAMEGSDIVAMARTGTNYSFSFALPCSCFHILFSCYSLGSGKTAAFLVPLFNKLREHSPKV